MQQHDADRRTAIRIAALAECDPRTVARELREPGSVRGLAGERIRKVLQTGRALMSADAGEQQ